MSKIDTQAILSEIYEERIDFHRDLYDKSTTHRIEHGPDCSVYPSSSASAPMWPLIAAMVDAQRFLEVGCGLGYTAALMAEAGGKNSHVDTVENVALHADLAEQELSRIGLASRVRVLRGEAKDILSSLTEPYDVVFVDADWDQYPDWLPELTRLTRRGGILVTSNLFPLFEEWAQDLPNKEAVKTYLSMLAQDSRFKTYIVPDRWQAFSYRG
jgi:predicted O-methyltransferase YrrM